MTNALENNKKWFFGENFDKVYCYHFFSSKRHGQYTYLCFFVLHYLKWGENIAIYDLEGIPKFNSEVPVSRIDVSSKKPGEALLHETRSRHDDTIYWFFDSKGVSKFRDTDILKYVNFDYRHVNTCSFIECGNNTTVSQLMSICGNSMSLYAIYDLCEVNEALKKYGGRVDQDYDVDYHDFVKALEVVRHCEEPPLEKIKSTRRYDNIRYDGKTEYADCKVVRFMFAYLGEINTKSMLLKIPSTNIGDITMFIIIDRNNKE